MQIKKKTEREWKPIAGDGIEYCELRRNDAGGGAGLVRIPANARFPLHNHPGWEEALILSGEITIGGQHFVEGDYLFTEPGELHAAIAQKNTVFYVSSEKGIEIVEE